MPTPQGDPNAMLQLNDAVSELNARLAKLEDERDFYRALLESPRRDEIRPPPGQAPASGQRLRPDRSPPRGPGTRPGRQRM